MADSYGVAYPAGVIDSMNKSEIRSRLKAHREHFRVLPTLAMNELNEIIEALDEEEKARDADLVTFDEVVEEAKQKKVEKQIAKEINVDVGKRTRKAAKKSKRSKR